VPPVAPAGPTAGSVYTPVVPSQRSRPHILPAWAALALVAALVTAVLAASPAPIVIGAVFPLSTNAASLANEELRGVQLAADMVNEEGGVHGRKIVLDVHDLPTAGDAPGVMAQIRAAGASVVIGAYSSELSVPAAAAASRAGLVYWEAGAVADRLTGQGLPLVFRVGASGTNLGTNSGSFAVQELAPRLGRPASTLRVAIVAAQDDYASSVAAAAARTIRAAGASIVANLNYSLLAPQFADLMPVLAAARPDVLILASHVPDGVAFRQAMIVAGLHVGAFIGTTMAECDPDFARALGPDVVGVFASDRPVGGFRPDALAASTRAVYDQFAALWARDPGSNAQSNAGADAALSWAGGAWLSGSASGQYWPAGVGDGGSAAGPSSALPVSGPSATMAWNGPTEEGLSGFTAGWALFHDVLPTASGTDALSVAAAARAIDLPVGSLPNGAGLHFSTDPETLGQNLLAAAVIWQWQAVRHYTYVWPATYATGQIADVPLAR
jgi:branched-chain amino acid transport system substrate-binding protein